jgi:hypothetical protein
MSHVLAVVGIELVRASAFARLVALFERLNHRPLADREERTWCACGVVSKEYGTPQRIVRDASSGASLTIIGAWVGADNANIDSANGLLKRCLQEPLGRVARDIDGAFVLIFIDPRVQSVTIATDIVGSLHVFFSKIPGGVAVCTSARALAALGTGMLDPVAVQEFWAAGVVYENRSFWQGVSKIGPGRVLTIDAFGHSNESQYWSFDEVNGRSLSLGEASAQVSDALASAATRIARNYPNILADVTGGYDSRATICGFVRAGVPFSATVSGPKTSADVIVSEQISQTLKIPNYRMEIEAERTVAALNDALTLTDGEYELLEYARIAAIHRTHAQRGFSTSINGSFGELARGYWWELLFPWLGASQPLNADTLSQKRFAAIPYDAKAIEPSLRLNFQDHMRGVIARSAAPLAAKPNTTQMDHAYIDLRMQRWQGRIGSSTAHIWPSFSPFMFRSVLMPVLDAVPLARWRSLLVRRMLEDSAPTLANLPLEHGYPATTARLTNLHQFAPVLGHYVNRVKTKLAPRQSSPHAKEGDAVLMDQLTMRNAADWALGNGNIFSADQIPHYIDQASQSGLSLAGRRLLTIELALRSVQNAVHSAPGNGIL